MGFGGLHGGLTLALLARAMRQDAPDDTRLRSAKVRLHRPLSETFEIDTQVVRSGRVTALAGQAGKDGAVQADAAAIFGAERPASFRPVSRQRRQHRRRQTAKLFAIPPEFVPISTFMEIRPVGHNRPYAGCPEPELTAWIRLTEDDQPPDAYRFLLLMDALAPSYAAVLTDLQLIPTVELTVRPGQELQHASSPWILLHAGPAGRAPTAGWISRSTPGIRAAPTSAPPTSSASRVRPHGRSTASDARAAVRRGWPSRDGRASSAHLNDLRVPELLSASAHDRWAGGDEQWRGAGRRARVARVPGEDGLVQRHRDGHRGRAWGRTGTGWPRAMTWPAK